MTLRTVLLALTLLAAATAGARAEVRLIEDSVAACDAPCPRTAVIFIHGITGSRETWVNRDRGAYFPQLLADDPAFAGGLDVYRVDYDSWWNEGEPIVSIGKALAAQLDPIIIKRRYSRIVFVVHSLGGNIARAYLLHVKARYGHAALGRFRLLITLGTPMEGASIARLALGIGHALPFGENDQLRSLLEIKQNDFLQLLNLNLQEFTLKHIDNGCPTFEIDAGFEQLPVPLIGIVVPEASATLDATRTMGFERTHATLPKPGDRDDAVYRWVEGEIAACIAGTERCQAPEQPERCSAGDFPAE